MNQTGSANTLSKHRIEALTDGIYAVAMTLLVIELKLPAHESIKTQADLINAVGHLLPKFLAWVISFLVLALFWLGHHKLFHNVRHVDGRLLALNLVQLGLVSLMPFSSALSGEFGATLFSQIFYSMNMSLLALLALLIARHIYQHPELWHPPMSKGAYLGSRFRIAGLIVISAVAIGIASVLPAGGNVAFMLMMGASQGVISIVRGAVPLALFGSKGYGTVLGYIATPIMFVSAASPTVFAWIVDQWGWDVGRYVLLCGALASFVAMELMSAWYERQRRTSQPVA